LKLQRLQQGSMCVDEYYKLMESMLLKVGLQFESEEEKVARFVSGLRKDIQDLVELYEYSSLDKVLHLATKVETQLQKKKEAKRNGSYNDYYSSTWKDKERKHDKSPPKSSQDPPPRTNSFRPSNETPKGTRTSFMKCFNCLGYGHTTSNCPTKRTMALNLKKEVESEHSSPPSPKSTSSHTSSSCERIKPLEVGLLMIRHQLRQVSKELDPSQRQNLFHSRCHINDKLCPLLIDNGSCVNVASTRVVEKLGLKTIPHAKPYKLSRLKKEDIKVTQQVLINFSIGNFKDEVLCDVVPMEATHILLGRPWQFDRKVFYDGHANTYAFSFQGKKFTLLPLSPNQTNEDPNKVKDKRKDEKEK